LFTFFQLSRFEVLAMLRVAVLALALAASVPGSKQVALSADDASQTVPDALGLRRGMTFDEALHIVQPAGSSIRGDYNTFIGTFRQSQTDSRLVTIQFDADCRGVPRLVSWTLNRNVHQDAGRTEQNESR
jgi:hypothetical protein